MIMNKNKKLAIAADQQNSAQYSDGMSDDTFGLKTAAFDGIFSADRC
jgi:hypothetical protein